MRFLILLALVPATLVAQNWPGFRGEGARGIAASPNLPVKWNVESGENILWKTPTPGLGLSSPVVWGNRIFLTTAISSNPNMVFEAKLIGERDNRQDPAEQEFRVLALDRTSGRIVWNQLALKTKPRILRHPHNSYASPTIATDGRILVAFFGSEGLYAYNLDGKLLWQKDLGAFDQGAFDVQDYQWGSASSPALWKGRIFLQADLHKDSFLASFDSATGKELWRTPRDAKPSWATPTVIETEKGAELIANGVPAIKGYDPLTGKELWTLSGTSMIPVPTPFMFNNLIYVFTGYFRYERHAYAIRPGSRGDLAGSKTALAWTRDEAPYLSTPVIAGGYVYAFGNRGSGILRVYDAASGATVFENRIGMGTGASASPIVSGDRVYLVNEDGEVYVLRSGSKYDELAVNKMNEPVLATPAAAGDILLIRGARHLFAIRGK